MNSKQFLEMVWPDQGFYCIATPNKTRTGYRHHIFTSLDDAYTDARAMFQHVDTYFCIHTLIQDRVFSQKHNAMIPSRKKENMRAARTLFLDLDVGKGTREKPKYASQQEAFATLSKFIFQTGIPRPWVVSSGNGLHVYWPFTDEVSSDLWRGHALNLRLLLDKHNIIYDPSRTTDITSVLRVPSTLNHKDPANLKPVKIIFDGDPPADNDQLFGWLALATAGLQTIRPSRLNASGLPSNITPGMLGFPPTDADDVAAECEQIRMFRDTKGNISEPHWYAGLGVLAFCTDGEQVAHTWSQGHPNYSAQETTDKINQWKTNGSVTSCNKLGSDGVANVCAKCPHFGGVHKNPIVIVNKKPLTQAFVAQQTPSPTGFQPPPPPHPYKRLAGLAVVRDDPKGLPVAVMSAADLYPISTSAGVYNGLKINNGMSKWVSREYNITGAILTNVFDVPNELLADPKAMSTHFAAHGLYHPATTEVVRYMSAYLKELKRHVGMAQQHPHIGWPNKDDISSFTLNGKVIEKSGSIRPCTMAASTYIVTDSMAQGGTLQNQVEALKFFRNTKAYAVQQFFIGCSLATPLFMATGHHGVVVNISGDSSAGKTTAMKAAGGLWGDPGKFVINGTARGMSAMARDARAMALPNLPTCIDEITHMEPFDARATVMGVSQGQLRQTLTGTREAREKPTGHRATYLLTNGNSSLHQIINMETKAAGTAASARVLELIADTSKQIHTKDEADAINLMFSKNFGWLGEHFMVLAMPTMEHLFDSVRRMNAKLNHALNAQGIERFQISAAAPVFVALTFAAYHGLIDWDVKALYDWFIREQHPALRAEMASQANAVAPDTVLRDFLSEHVLDTITTDPTNPSNIPPAMVRNQVVAHLRPDLNEAWVNVMVFRDWCVERGVNANSTLNELVKQGILLHTNTRRYLGEGTKYQVSYNRVMVLKLDDL